MRLIEQLRDDAEEVGLTGGDWNDIANRIIEAADRIAELEDQLDEAAGGVHSCHPQCQRPACVQRRRIAELEKVNNALQKRPFSSEVTRLRDRIAELDDALRKACALAECERWHERFPKCHGAMIKALEQKDESD